MKKKKVAPKTQTVYVTVEKPEPKTVRVFAAVEKSEPKTVQRVFLNSPESEPEPQSEPESEPVPMRNAARARFA